MRPTERSAKPISSLTATSATSKSKHPVPPDRFRAPDSYRASRVHRIFISSFVTDTFHGLPNLIIGRLMSALQSNIARKPIDVYGPPGLIKYLNATLPLSVRPEFHSHFSLLTVHELVLDDKLIGDLDKHQRAQFKWTEEYANRLRQKAFQDAADEAVEPSLFNTRQIHRDPATNSWILAEEEKVGVSPLTLFLLLCRSRSVWRVES